MLTALWLGLLVVCGLIAPVDAGDPLWLVLASSFALLSGWQAHRCAVAGVSLQPLVLRYRGYLVDHVVARARVEAQAVEVTEDNGVLRAATVVLTLRDERTFALTVLTDMHRRRPSRRLLGQADRVQRWLDGLTPSCRTSAARLRP